jgi:hypothetical protein
MKLTKAVLLFGLLLFVGCKVHHHGRAKVIRMSDGEKAFKMGDDWYWNMGTGDEWVKNDSYTPWTYAKARPVEEREEEMNVEEEQNGANELEATESPDPGTGGDVGTDAGDASGDSGDGGDGGGGGGGDG